MPREIGGKRFRVSGYDTYVPARRRRLRRRRLAAAAGIGVVVLATGGWYGYYNVIDKPTTNQQAATTCPKPAHGTRPAATGAPVLSALTPGQVTVNVYNDTTRTGLAAITANNLRGRGFAIGKVANDPVKETIAGTALVRGNKVQLARLQLVGAQVSGTQEVFDTRADPSVDLVLGNTYGALSPANQASAAVAAAEKADATAAPAPIAASTCK